MTDWLSNRDWAVVVWGVVFFIITRYARSMRSAVSGVARALLTKSILLILVSICTYISVCCLTLWHLDLWSVDLLKDTLLYVAVAFGYVFRVYRSGALLGLRSIVIESVGLGVLLTYALNFYSFSFTLELLLLPVIMVPRILSAYMDSGKSVEEVRQKRSLRRFSTTIDCGLLIYFAFSLLNQPSEFFTHYTLWPLLFPTLLTLAYLPFLYILLLYTIYDETFRVLKCVSRGGNEQYKFRRKTLLMVCGVNLQKLQNVRHYWSPLLPPTNEGFIKEIEAASKKQRISYYGE